jgi:hypothetical protein
VISKLSFSLKKTVAKCIVLKTGAGWFIGQIAKAESKQTSLKSKVKTMLPIIPNLLPQISLS